MISGFQALRQARMPVAGLELATEGSPADLRADSLATVPPAPPWNRMLSLVASISTLSVIAGDRFFGIVFAMKAHFVERRASCTIVLIWVFSLLIASPLLFVRRYQEERWRNLVEGWCDDVWPVEVWLDEQTGTPYSYSPLRRLYYMIVCVVLFFVPCLIMTVAYAVIIVTVWSAKVPGERISKDIKSQIRLRKRIIKMLVVIQSVFVLCWLPLIISLIYAEFVHKRHQTLDEWYIHYSYFACYLAYANSAINPFIYAGFNANFMKGKPRLYQSVWRYRDQSSLQHNGFSHRLIPQLHSHNQSLTQVGDSFKSSSGPLTATTAHSNGTAARSGVIRKSGKDSKYTVTFIRR
ncbi:substance-p receptor-like [Plakobranchus ocellatus]|uniref:Substance-p receptor-like n=1 Tax=Plakobranchus ocellatus TaxID=259542 RepID=A0AAV4D3U6_9GAST|nr:substance-p receptor-like [Plakobranchus ocellatus]